MNIKRFGIILSGILASLMFLQAGTVWAEPVPAAEATADSPEMAAYKDALRAKDWQKAAELGEAYVQAHPDESVAWGYLGVVYTNLDKNARALECFETEHAKGGSSLDNLRSRALLSLELKRPTGLELILEAAKAMPDEAYIQYLAGKTLSSSKRDAEAPYYFEKAIALEPMNSAYVVALATRYEKYKNYEMAVKVTKNAIDAGNKEISLYINNCVYNIKAKNYNEVIEWADLGWAVKEDPLLMYHKARALVHLGRYAEAETLIRNMSMSHFGTKQYLAMALMGQGCDLETYKTCAGNAPDACCARESEALEIYADIESLVDDKRKEDYIINYSLALAISGKTSAAEGLLKTSSLERLSEALALQYAIIAVNESWIAAEQGVPGVSESAKRMYREARGVLKDIESDEFGVKHVWPKRAIETLSIIRNAVNPPVEQTANATVSKKAGLSSCGCDIKSEAPASTPWIAAVLALLGVGLLRRKRNHE